MEQVGTRFHIDYQYFLLEVYIIGYRTKGESIVVLFKERNYVFYSIVIDCNHKKNINRADQILRENGVKKVPMIIMSHPHEDHILGIEALIDKYCDESSKFYYPARSFDIDLGIITLTPKEKSILQLVRAKNKEKKTFSNYISVSSGGLSELGIVKLYDNNDPDEEFPINIEINALTPISSVNDEKASYNSIDPNDLSISIILCIQDYYLYFGADAPNDHLSLIDRRAMSLVKFVKIPHHASDTSDILPDFFLDGQLEFACSTSFYAGRSHLPLPIVLDRYSLVSDRVDIIGSMFSDPRRGSYGEIRYQFQFGPTKMLTQIQEKGLTQRYS